MLYIEGEIIIALRLIHRYIIDVVGHLELLDRINDLPGGKNHAGVAAVCAPHHRLAGFDRAECRDGRMLYSSLGTPGPSVICHVDDQIGTVSNKIGRNVSEYILIADRCRELHAVTVKDNGIITLLPPVEIKRHKDVIKSSKRMTVL